MKQPRTTRYKDLRLSQLRSYCEVCRLHSFAAAAAALHLTTPAVWEQVRALEMHYGVKLLKRVGRTIELTAEGAALFDSIRRLLGEFDATHELLRQQSGALPERVTVVVSLRVQMHEVLRALRQFQVIYPTVGLRLRQVDSADVGPLLLSQDADLGVMLKPGPRDESSPLIAYEPISEMDFLLVAPRGHPLIGKRALKISDIVAYPLVLGRPEAFSRRRFEEVLHSHQLEASARIALETSSGSLTLAAVREGLGVGIVACMPNGVQTEGLGVRSLRRWFGTAQVVFARRRGGPLAPVQQHLADAIRQNLSEGGIGSTPLGKEARTSPITKG
jgi:DNA-binding transcriptional LysR family regulator